MAVAASKKRWLGLEFRSAARELQSLVFGSISYKMRQVKFSTKQDLRAGIIICFFLAVPVAYCMVAGNLSHNYCAPLIGMLLANIYLYVNIFQSMAKIHNGYIYLYEGFGRERYKIELSKIKACSLAKLNGDIYAIELFGSGDGNLLCKYHPGPHYLNKLNEICQLICNSIGMEPNE
jgi:hypothetical protein